MTEPNGKPKTPESAKSPEKIKKLATRVRKSAGSGLPARIPALRQPKWQRWILIVVTAFIAAFIMAPRSIRIQNLTVGETAPTTIISPVTFRVIDEAATIKNRDEILQSVQPVYNLDDTMARDIKNRIISAFSFMNDYFNALKAYKARKHIAESPEKTNGKAKTPDGTATSGPTFRPLDDQALRARFENLLGVQVSPADFALLKSVDFNFRAQNELRSLVVPVLSKGVVLSRELLMRDGRDGVLLWSKSKGQLEPLKDLSVIFDLKEAVNFINAEDKDGPFSLPVSRAIRRIAMDMINANITFNREKTEDVKKKALAQVKDVYFQVSKGEPIIREGEPINEGHLRKLEGLRKAHPQYNRYVILLGFALTLTLLLRLCSYISEKHMGRSQYASQDLLLMCFLMVGSVLMTRVVASLAPALAAAQSGLSSDAVFYAVPFATGPMLVALMVDARTAFVFSVLAAVASTLAVEGDVYLFFFFFISGVVGLHGMSHITERSTLMRSGLVVGFVNMLSILAVKMALGELSSTEQLFEIAIGLPGGILSGLLAMGIAPLLEPLGYITNVKLLELANLNHRLLKEVSLVAPGTYHHSITVGNLAETAAELIGANPLLARVGGYYHDIGKAGKQRSKPIYFIENQQRGINPHDKLEPSMSALILVSHVKTGVEKAREHRLGEPIVDIIRQHHGTNLIAYFYNKAQERAEKKGQTVPEEKFRYPGPLPQTKEAALVMLADVSEAACRTLPDPTPARIQKKVQTLIMGLFSSGQLDQSTLTLKDLHAITRSFVRALQGILHHRVVYPEDQQPKVAREANGDSSRKPADKDRSRSERAEEPDGKVIRRLGL